MPTLDWIGKNAAINHHNEVRFHLLKETLELSQGETGKRTFNGLFLQGDHHESTS